MLKDEIKPTTQNRSLLLSDDNHHWLKEFTKRHGRAPKVLHVGNIANNAYNNAKILNKVGIVNHVLCHDYYHSMSTPEWEDADFDGDLTDHFFPAWYKHDLNGFKRPRWFVQGTFRHCILYLSELNKISTKWHKINLHWQLLSSDNKSIKPAFGERTNSLLSKWPFFKHNLLKSVAKHTLKIPLGNQLVSFFYGYYNGAATIKRGISGGKTSSSSVTGTSLQGTVMKRKMSFWKKFPAQARRTITVVASYVRKIPLENQIVSILHQLLSFFHRLHIGLIINRSISGGRTSTKTSSGRKLLGIAMTRSLSLWNKFPALATRADPLTEQDVHNWSSSLEDWQQIFSDYDFIIAYSTCPIYPFLLDIPYFAFEHGTLRDIPYEKNSQGRMTALAYACAEHVFVTNFDCKKSAKTLAPGRFTLINHPYDEDRGLFLSESKQVRQTLKTQLDADYLFFLPTRHDWVEGTGYADKANDVFLQAFCELRHLGLKVGLVCCEWGANVRQSKDLLKSEQVDQHVIWYGPMPMVHFERMAKSCDVVVDQFKLGSFGGIVFKAMAVGSPILTYLNESLVKDQYPEIPPAINCRTKSEIVTSMQDLLSAQHLLEDIGLNSRKWILKYHSKVETVNLQVDQFRLLTARNKKY